MGSSMGLGLAVMSHMRAWRSSLRTHKNSCACGSGDVGDDDNDERRRKEEQIIFMM